MPRTTHAGMGLIVIATRKERPNLCTQTYEDTHTQIPKQNQTEDEETKRQREVKEKKEIEKEGGGGNREGEKTFSGAG